jgi:hypothetical protein
MKLYLAVSGLVLGGGMICYGLFLIFPPAAWIFTGACFVVAGFYSEVTG